MSSISVSSYSFHRGIKSGECTLADTPALAREAGADAIEFALGGPLSSPLTLDMSWSLHQQAEHVGIQISSIVIAAELYKEDPVERNEAIEQIIEQLEAAAAIGVRHFRHDASWGGPGGDISDRAFESALPLLAEACRHIAERASEMGVISTVENHGPFIQHAQRIKRLIEAVDHPAFGLTLDLGNSLWADQDHVEAARILAEFAAIVHVKDFLIDPPDSEQTWPTYEGGPKVLPCVIGEGDLNLHECIAAVVAANVEPVWVVEYEGPKIDPRQGVARSINWLRGVLAEP